MATGNSSTPYVITARIPILPPLKSPEITITVDHLSCIVYAAVRAALDAHGAKDTASPLWDAVVPAVERAVAGRD